MRNPIPVLSFAVASLAMAAVASAGDVLPTQFLVRQKTTGEMVTFRGKLKAPGDLESPASVEFHAGTFTETVPAASLVLKKSTLSYRAPKGTLGQVVQFSLSLRSGAFRLTAKDVAVGSLDGQVPVTLDVGGQRTTGLYLLKGTGKTRSWRKGMVIGGKLKGRVFRVDQALGNTVIKPVVGTTFVRNDAEEEVNVVGGEPKTIAGGVFNLDIEYKDAGALGRMDLARVLGEDAGMTRPGRVAVTPGLNGEMEVVVFLQDRPGGASTISAAAPTTLEATGSGGGPSGTLSVPAGAVAADVTGVTFTPYAMAVELPAPLPEEYVAVAGAEFRAAAEVAFVADAKPTVELSRPRWVERTALAPGSVDLRLLQFRNGVWEERPGKGTYDALSDRIRPDPADPAKLGSTGALVWAARVATGQGAALRGRVRDKDDNAVKGVTVLSRAGSMVSGARGKFRVARSTVSASSLEVLQVVREGTSVSKVVSAAAAATEGEVTVQVADEAPLDWKVGVLRGTIFEPDGTTPAAGAAVTIRLAGSVQGLEHDDMGTPSNFTDDAFTVTDLSALGVLSYEWALQLPGVTTEFVSPTETDNSANLLNFILDAQDVLGDIPEGPYTIRVRYTVPGLGDFDLYGGFRVSFEGALQTLTISDVQLPASYEASASASLVADGGGEYSTSFRAPIGIPLELAAASATTADTGSKVFQFATNLTVDLVLGDGTPPPPPPPGVDTGNYTWTTKTSMPTGRSETGAAAVGGKLYVIGGWDGGQSAANEAYDPSADSWTTRALMPTARNSHGVATVGGLVYAIGGDVGNVATAVVEAYDPTTNSWSTKAPLQTPRLLPAVAVLGGKIYVCGGFTNPVPTPAASVEVYDPGTNSWSYAAPLPSARASAAAAAVGGLLYTFGGYDGSSTVSVVDVYDPGTNTWTSRAPLSSARMGMSAEVLGTEVHVLGGTDTASGGAILATHGVYDTVGNSWSSGPAMSKERRNHASGVINDVIYVAGGADAVPTRLASVEAFGPAAPTWSTKAPMPATNYGHGTAGYGGKLYVAAGYNGGFLTSLWAYDPLSNSWSTKAPMGVGRTYVCFVECQGLLYVIGGNGASGSTGTVEAYDPSANSWTTRASMPTARTEAAAAALGGKIYVCGGHSGAVTDKVEVYDPATNSWTTAAVLPGPRKDAAVVAAGGKLYVLGGAPDLTGGNLTDTVFVYDPVGNSWTTAAAMPVVRSGGAAGVLNGEIHVVGGRVGAGVTLTATMDVYNPTTNSWRSGDAMPTARDYCTAGVVGGTLYVTGGSAGAATDLIEAYGQ